MLVLRHWCGFARGLLLVHYVELLLLLRHGLKMQRCWHWLRAVVRKEQVRWNRWVAVDGRVDRIILAPELMVTMGIAAPDAEWADALSVEVNALDCLEVGVGDAVVALREGLARNWITNLPQLMRTVRKRALIAKVTRPRGIVQLTNRRLVLAVHNFSHSIVFLVP